METVEVKARCLDLWEATPNFSLKSNSWRFPVRDFDDKDRRKKSLRTEVVENPANLAPEKLALLESSVRAALKDGYLSCPVGWKIARDMGVPKNAVGAIVDKLGIRVANCQLGFFRVDKITTLEPELQEPAPEITAAMRELDGAGELKCPAIFELAHRFKTTPMKVSEAASTLALKIRGCQLGCF
jgi:hypothetical protein